ncbi:MAG: hypothetical protein ABH846_04920 [Patescibacteria group bacterium]
MAVKMFSDGDLIKDAWGKTLQKLLILIGSYVLAMLTIFVPALILMWIGGKLEAVGLFALLTFIYYVVSMALVGVGMTRIFLAVADGKDVSIMELWTNWDKFLNYLAVTILYMLIVVGGFFLLIFPGYIWMTKFYLAPFYVADKNMGPIEALKLSSQTTMGLKWDVFAFLMVIGTVMQLGFLALFVGALVTIPMGLVACAGLYRTLAGSAPAKPMKAAA